MKRILPCLLAGALGLMAFGAGAAPQLSVEQVLDRHIAARGGAEAWHKIQAMAWTGHIESGPGGISKVPFLMTFQRPAATRFEVLAQGQHSVRIFDGSKGWRLTPVDGGLPTVNDYSPEEVSYARDAAGLDGPLFDPASKGVKVVLVDMDTVEGHSAYQLKLTLPSGQVRHDWIDAQSFLELKYERVTHSPTGIPGVVSVYYRNYQTFEGLVIPLVMESGGPASKVTDKMIIEKVALNPTFATNQFAKPNAPRKHNGIVIDTRSAGLDEGAR